MSIDRIMDLENQRQQGASNDINQGLNTIGNEVVRQDTYKKQQAELDRPVEQPVQNLLNRLSTKMRANQLSGQTGAYIFKLFQAGRLTHDQALSAIEHPELAGVGAPPPPTGAPPVGGMSLPEADGTPPVPIKSEVVAPNGIDPSAFAAPGTPPQRISRSPTSSGVPEAAGAPPMPPPPPQQASGGQVQQPQAQSSYPPPPPPDSQEIAPDNYVWTNRTLHQLQQAGGFPQEPKKTDTDYILDALKNINTNGTRRDVAAANNDQRDQELKAKVSSWEANRQNAWAIAMARIKSMESVSSGKFDAARDTKLLREAQSAIKTLRDNDTKLRTSIGALAQDPNVTQQIEQNEQLIQQAEAKLAEAEARVKAFLGETTRLPPRNPPTPVQGQEMTFKLPPVAGTTTTRTVTPSSKPAPSPTEFLKSLRGR